MIEHKQCRLCGNDGPLCRSHIVPELAYNPIKNDKSQMYNLGRKAVQVGYREKMLCQTCEGILSAYETKFKELWMDTISPDFNHLATGPEDVITVRVPRLVAEYLWASTKHRSDRCCKKATQESQATFRSSAYSTLTRTAVRSRRYRNLQEVLAGTRGITAT